MLPAVVGICCAIWLVSGVTMFVLGLFRIRNAKRQADHYSTERDMHNGSNLVAGAIIALMLGPVGLVFYFVDKGRS